LAISDIRVRLLSRLRNLIFSHWPPGIVLLAFDVGSSGFDVAKIDGRRLFT